MSMRCAALVCLALASALALSGCGKTTATVSGVVKYQGEPLPSGTVLIYGSDGVPKTGAIGEDGKYKVDDAPLGQGKIPVQVVDISASPIGGGGRGAGGPGGAGGAPGGSGDAMANGPPGAAEHMKPMPGGDRKVVKIPTQYMSPDTSGKTATLK